MPASKGRFYARGYLLNAPNPPQHANTGRAGDPGNGAVPGRSELFEDLNDSVFLQRLKAVPFQKQAFLNRTIANLIYEMAQGIRRY